MTAVLGRRLFVEFIGTALLVIFGAGAVVAALEVGQGRLDYAGLGMIGLSFALVIAAVVDMFGTTSSAAPRRGASFGCTGPARSWALAALAYVLVAQPERASVEAELPRGTAGDVVGRRVVRHGERSARETTSTIEGRPRHVR